MELQGCCHTALQPSSNAWEEATDNCFMSDPKGPAHLLLLGPHLSMVVSLHGFNFKPGSALLAGLILFHFSLPMPRLQGNIRACLHVENKACIVPFVPDALNVKVNNLKQARVTSFSSHDPFMVAKLLFFPNCSCA